MTINAEPSTRERILHTGLALMSQSGLNSLTLGALAEQIGMSKSGLFAHFRSKETVQIELLNGQKPRLQKEIDALNAQIATLKNRLEFVKNETSRSAQLVKQGLGVHASEVQLKLQEANEESNHWSLAAQLSRLQMNIGELDIKIEEAEASFTKQTLAELQNVRQRSAELNVTLPSAREIRDFKLQQAENATGIEDARSINITRTRHGQVVVLDASETTPVEPGDVVDIRVDIRKALPGRLGRLPAPAG